MEIDLAVFRNTMGSFASGVTVVTTRQEHQVYGITISAFISLSLRPPLVLISVAKNTLVSSIIAETKIFAVNVLSENQRHLSRSFSTSSPERYQHFCHAEYWTSQTGAPILTGSAAYIDCILHTIYDGGDHTIFIGEVKDLGTNDVLPLLYFRGAYHALASKKDYEVPLTFSQMSRFLT